MEKRKITIDDSVIVFLEELTNTLYKEEYFGFLEAAEDYVNNLIDGIYSKLNVGQYYESPDKLKRYGNYYTKLNPNNHTTWYVFFNKKDDYYLVEYLTNNHTPQSAFFNLE